jgi:uncharacterized membrane protein YphA (DoxX/SURF4 family)
MSTDGLGRLFFAVALVGFAVENVLFGHYVVARAAPWPTEPEPRLAVAAVTGLVFALSGAAILTGRFTREAGLTAAGLILGWSLTLHWPKAIAGPPWSGDWTNALKAVTLAAGGVCVAATAPRPVPGWLAAARASAPWLCAPFFLLAAIQHHLFVQFVATLVPPFIPFPRFWTYVAAVALLAAGLGLLLPPTRRLAAVMTGWMVFTWVFLVHVPLLFTVGAREWMGVFEALGVSGVCLLLAGSTPPAPRAGAAPTGV